MTELIIGKTYSLTDVRSNKKYVFKILNKVKNDNKIYYTVIGRYNISYTIDISLYINIEEIHEGEINIPSLYGGEENPHEPMIGNVVKYILRAGIKYPLIEGKIEDLKKAIWYLGREIDNLEKEKNNG